MVTKGSQSDCILLATNGDDQSINAYSPNVHINLKTLLYKKWKEEEEKWLKTMPNKKPIYYLLLTLLYMAVGLYDTHSFEWPFLLKFLCTKIVRQFVFLVQSIVFMHIFLNL